MKNTFLEKEFIFLCENISLYMEYNIFSPVKCLLKVNGLLKGVVYNQPISLSAQKGDFLEFISPDNSFITVNCLLGENNENVRVFENCFANFIFPKSFSLTPLSYEMVFCKRFFSSSVSISVINDCSSKILIENHRQAKLLSLPFKATVPEVVFEKNQRIGLFFKENGYLLVINGENCERVISKRTDSVICENDTLILQSNLPTILKHIVTEKYDFPFKEGTRFCSRKKNVTEILPDLSGFCFLECLRIYDDVSDFLCEDFNGQDHLKDFLGDYLFIFPSPSEKFEYALVYEDKIKFLTFKRKNGKICDVVTND